MRKTFLIIISSSIIIVSCANRNKTDSNSVAQSRDSVHPIKADSDVVPPPVLPKPKKQDSLKVVLGKNRVLEDYAKNLNIFENLISKRQDLPLELLEGIIPVNQEEFSHFYRLSAPEEYPESNIDLYWGINDIMEQSALSNQGNCIYLYLNLAEFVDGEYADSFFEVIPFLAEKNQLKFCNVYYDLSDRSQYRLRDIFDDYCE